MISDFLDYLKLLALLFVGSSRAVGFVLLFPLFTWLEIDTRLRLMLAIILSAPTISALMSQSAFNDVGFALILLFSLKEIAIGMALALVLGLPVFGFQAVGDMIDHARGGLAPNQTDPINAAQISDSAKLLTVVALLWMVASGAFLIALEILIKSHLTIPVATLSLDALVRPGNGVVELLYDLTHFGLRFAAPLFILLALLHIGTTFATLGASNIDINDLLVIIKNFAYVLALPIYLITLIGYLGAEFVASLMASRALLGTP